MEKKMHAILDVLKELNSKTDIVIQEEIDEQSDNIEDFKVLSNQLDGIVSDSKRINFNNGEEVEEVLAEFHRILTTFEWHFSEMSDLNMKIYKEYKDKISRT